VLQPSAAQPSHDVGAKPGVELQPSARERVHATRIALSVDNVAILLAALIALAVAVGLIPSVPW
jgi:hypothetical protein